MVVMQFSCMLHAHIFSNISPIVINKDILNEKP
jgi:hypothetical protein